MANPQRLSINNSPRRPECRPRDARIQESRRRGTAARSLNRHGFLRFGLQHEQLAIGRRRSMPNAATPCFAEISGSWNRVLLANNIADTRNDFIANAASGSVVTDNNFNF